MKKYLKILAGIILLPLVIPIMIIVFLSEGLQWIVINGIEQIFKWFGMHK